MPTIAWEHGSVGEGEGEEKSETEKSRRRRDRLGNGETGKVHDRHSGNRMKNGAIIRNPLEKAHGRGGENSVSAHRGVGVSVINL